MNLLSYLSPVITIVFFVITQIFGNKRDEQIKACLEIYNIDIENEIKKTLAISLYKMYNEGGKIKIEIKDIISNQQKIIDKDNIIRICHAFEGLSRVLKYKSILDYNEKFLIFFMIFSVVDLILVILTKNLIFITIIYISGGISFLLFLIYMFFMFKWKEEYSKIQNKDGFLK